MGCTESHSLTFQSAPADRKVRLCRPFHRTAYTGSWWPGRYACDRGSMGAEMDDETTQTLQNVRSEECQTLCNHQHTPPSTTASLPILPWPSCNSSPPWAQPTCRYSLAYAVEHLYSEPSSDPTTNSVSCSRLKSKQQPPAEERASEAVGGLIGHNGHAAKLAHFPHCAQQTPAHLQCRQLLPR